MSQLSNHGRNQIATLLTDPWTQGVLSGAMTLIPARKYPGWLRQGLIWGPTVLGSAGGTYLALNPGARRKLMAKLADTGQTIPIDSGHHQNGDRNSTDTARRLSIIGAGSAAGAASSLVMGFGFWADEAIDRGLRRMRVPFPRVVMGVTVGALTWWMETIASDTSV